MVDKKRFLFLAIFLAIAAIYVLPYVSSADICCEQTINGAICQDNTSDNCATGAAQTETSCELTAFCKLGTCIDNDRGECKPNTPRKACEEIDGFWDERDSEEIPQCSLGCCFIGGETSFVTSTQCKTLAGLYGVEKIFDETITNPIECIASGTSEVKGACVYAEEGEFGNACSITTENECRLKRIDFPDSNAEFFEDYLCNAEELNTNCVKSPPLKATTCSEEIVYFTDTCGNLANVYDSTRYNDESYWTKMIKPEDSCGFGLDVGGNTTCGNCMFGLGSTCSAVKRGETGVPKYGNYICRNLDCEYDGDGDGDKETYQHGEKWCAVGRINQGVGAIDENKTRIPDPFRENVPGSSYFVMTCRDGEVDYEMCGEGVRDQICSQTTVYPDGVTPFRNAACSVNEWGDCTSIANKEDCEDVEIRDCKWIPTFSRTDDDRLTTWIPRIEGDSAPLIKTDGSLPKGRTGFNVQQILGIISKGGMERLININNYRLGNDGEKRDSNFQHGVCVPKYAPGFDFMANFSSNKEEQRDKLAQEGSDICSLASATCVVKYEKKLGGTWTAKENSECEPDPDGGPYLWRESMNNICVSLGDCGSTVNYIGQPGDVKDDFKGLNE